MRHFLRILLCSFYCIATLAAAEPAIDWDSAKSVYPGIKLVRLKRNTPLTTPGLAFTVTGRAPGWGKPMPDYPKLPIRTKRATPAAFMLQMRKPVKAGGRGLNVVAAFNASPWRPWTSPFNHKFADPPGLNISDGVIVGDRGGKNPVFVVYKDGKVDILDKVPKQDIPKIKDAVAGYHRIVRDGKVLPDVHPVSKGCHPRTAYGLSADRRFLYVVVIDGRQKKWSLGTKGSETGRIMLEAGADDAINMDGGGSSAMCVWDRRKNKPVRINRQGGGYMRPVANNLGIVLDGR